MDIYCVRHTAVLNPHLCYGHSDVPLAPSFLGEAAAVAERLSLPPAGIMCYASPAERCRRLASSILPQTAVHCDERLREMHFGSWEGRAWDAIERAEIDAWAEDFVHNPAPGGESFTMLAARVKAFWDELIALQPMAPILVVTHGGWIRALLSQLRGTRLKDAFATPIDYGAAFHVTLTGSELKIENL